MLFSRRVRGAVDLSSGSGGVVVLRLFFEEGRDPIDEELNLALFVQEPSTARAGKLMSAELGILAPFEQLLRRCPYSLRFGCSHGVSGFFATKFKNNPG